MSEREMHIDVEQRLTRRGVARLAAAALVVTSLGAARLTGVAAQESVAECQAEITALRAATSQVTTFTNAKDQTGLLGKLDSASTKLTQGKFANAIQALTQFRDKVATLQSQGKIGPEDADALIAAANEVIACIQALIATA